MRKGFQSLLRFLDRFRRDRSAAVTIMMAASLTGLLATTALAVDMGSIYLAKRELQGTADAAALAAVDMMASPNTAAEQVIAANHLANAQVASLVPGTYTPDGTLTPTQRFVPATPVPNAVQVTLAQSVPLFFGNVITGRGTTRITATATAARIDYAAFSIGTRLAAVQGGLPNALLKALTGTDLNLSVADYNSLVGTQINLLTFSQALATRLNLTAASFNDTLNAKATLPQALSALADAAGNPAAAAALQNLALKVPPTTVQLSNLINLGPYGSQDHADPSTAISADGYSIVREMLQLANGQRQVSADLGATIPGVTSTNLSLAMGERQEHSPWLTVAQDGTVTVRTAQARLYLDTNLAALGLASVHLPIYTELAEAQAKLASISCQGQGKTTVALNVLPSVGSVAVANVTPSQLSNFTTPVSEQQATIAQLLPVLPGLPVTNVVAKTHLDLGGSNAGWQQTSFSPADIAAHTIHTLSTGDLTQGVASSLLNKTTLTAQVLGTPVNLSSLTSTVGALLAPLAPALDSLLDQVTDLLGVHVGQADVGIDGVRCGTPSLVA